MGALSLTIYDHHAQQIAPIGHLCGIPDKLESVFGISVDPDLDKMLTVRRVRKLSKPEAV